MNIRLPTREEIHIAFAQGEAVVVDLFLEVGQQIEELAGQLEKQSAVLKELQAQLARNSQNSSKPPSTDVFCNKKPKPKGIRKSSCKKAGGQKGHSGKTLEMVEN